MYRLALLALLSVVWPAAVLAQAPSSPSADTRPAMQFEWVREGPPEKCRDRCREWISATGRIIPATARSFVEFMQKRQARGATVVIESDGGAVGASMALGRLFRQLGIATTVGRTTKLPPGSDGTQRAELSPAAVCASMCPFVVLGGARRHIPQQARVMVHQIWPRLKRDDAVAATYGAQDVVGLQRELGTLARYVVEMGGDIELFEIALRIPPWENLRPFRSDELRRLKLTNTDDPFAAPASGAALDSAATIVPTVAKTPEAFDRGWLVNETAGPRGFARRHPLTIEGEPIGTFELAFACNGDGVVGVTYTEHRRSQPDASDRVAGVGIASGKDHRLILKVQSSAPEGGSDEIKSIASATVPAAFLDSLAETEGKTLVVATQTRRRVRTVIRPGNTGFSESFKKTIATCRK
jgi:hypothetical protein